MHSHKHHNHAETHSVKNKKFLFFSFLISIFLAVSKFTIGFLSNSSALIASSIDSIMDATSTSINWFILNESSKPADHDHPFGHGKFEAFSGLIQGIFITGISIALLSYSILQIFEQNIKQAEVENMQIIGIIITIIAIIIPLVLSYYMKRQAKKSSSLILEAEHSHFFADGIMNAGVLFGLTISYFFQIYWIDSIIGIAIAIWLFLDIKDLLLQSFDILTDKKLPTVITNQISKTLKECVQKKTILGWHDLQTRRSGSEYHINIHLEFDNKILLEAAHKKSDIIEENIKNIFPNAIILTHFDLHSEYLTSNTCNK